MNWNHSGRKQRRTTKTAQDDIDEADTILYAPEESDDEQFNMAIDETQ